MTAVSLPVIAPVVSWLVVAAVAAALARLLTWSVGRAVGDGPRSSAMHRGIEAAFVVAALVLWWWEIHTPGRVPRSDAAAAGLLSVGHVTRYAAHLVLMALLAAAAWVDLRHRVIPDGITVPGVLTGLVWTTVDPRVLLPVVREVPRSFAAPAEVADVLGLVGPLHGDPPPHWLGGWPAPAGLAAAVLVYAVWWFRCTAPRDDGPAPSAWWRDLRDPRPLILGGGLAWIGATWWTGGDHWLGLLTSLAGIAVSAGVIWLIRAGASWALGQEAMGLGDVTLMAMVGAWLGWQPCLLVCFLAVFIGLAHGLGQVLLRREHELPFGPSLCLAAAAVVVLWQPLWERTADVFARPLDLALTLAVVVVLTALSLFVWRRLRGDPV